MAVSAKSADENSLNARPAKRKRTKNWFKQERVLAWTVRTGHWRGKVVEFRAWYNHARPRQHLGMRTPAEAWSDRPRSTKPPRLLRVWEGELVGWYFPT
jgi:hypothetical protein